MSVLVIIISIMILIGGGIGTYFIIKKKEQEKKDKLKKSMLINIDSAGSKGYNISKSQIPTVLSTISKLYPGTTIATNTDLIWLIDNDHQVCSCGWFYDGKSSSSNLKRGIASTTSAPHGGGCGSGKSLNICAQGQDGGTNGSIYLNINANPKTIISELNNIGFKLHSTDMFIRS